MGRRAYSRQPNGRFRRATLENTFGLSAPSCPECGRLNPHSVGEPAPENCHACGAAMNPDAAMVADLIGQEQRGVQSVHGTCPDGGTCHHGCGEGPCWRVGWCGPLSGVFRDDHWPADVYERHAGHLDES